jgi:hypothetical protein
MPRKAPPFRQRIKDALAVAREEGCARMQVKTPDGAVFEFDFKNAPKPEPLNDFDTIPPKRGHRRHETPG